MKLQWWLVIAGVVLFVLGQVSMTVYDSQRRGHLDQVLAGSRSKENWLSGGSSSLFTFGFVGRIAGGICAIAGLAWLLVAK